MGDNETNNETKSTGSETSFKAAPMERLKQTGNKIDPYVLRAMERAQHKLKVRVDQMNGGHVN